MSDIIHLLPDNIANQIAAGEVIQRPASVVKELIENSIDAGATTIQVNIKDAGRTLIQVTDNGKGMSETDARMAFERHATSKISSAEDLFALHTMGFRGEALASIVAVSQVELNTRLRGNEIGSHLEFAGSILQTVEPTATAEGSSFLIKNLFYNIPARRKFLKSNETEFRNILTEFERVALVNPQVAMSLIHQDTEIYQLGETGLRQRIINIFGKTLNQKLLSIDVNTTLATISGFVGKPESSKKRGAMQYFFVNGRFMKHPFFHKAIMQAYEHLIPVGEQPNYFIYFTLDPATIDVNIHPTKTEIKFENEQPIWQILIAAVREALAKSSAIPTIDFNTDNVIDIPVYQFEKDKEYAKSPSVKVDSSYDPFENTSYKKPEFDWAKLYNSFESQKNEVCTEIEEISTSTIDYDLTCTDTVQPCYQYKSKYVVTSLKSGIVLIDQHRAHVRILFDQYISNMYRQQGASQQILFPEEVEFTKEEMSILPDIMGDLQFIGFSMECTSENIYIIKGLPSGIENQGGALLIKEMISHALETGSRVHEKLYEAMVLPLAKTAAIRHGKVLSAEEMDNLVASLFSCTEPNLTPDGKTILSMLTDDEIELRFK